MRHRQFGSLALGMVLGALFLAVVGGMLSVWAGSSPVSSGWTPLFSETFSPLSTTWTISDTTGGQYRWGAAAYSGTLGADSGLWAAGGGSLGAAQTWPTGTYTNGMTTWAVAGPFTPAGRVWGIRLRLQVQDRLAAGDSLFVGLSYDNVHFEGITLTHSLTGTEWHEVVWSPQAAYTGTAPVWVGLRFSSDGAEVDAGPLVDDLTLEVNAGYESYLPMVRREPTPTPTSTPTPLPGPYRDEFTDPASGWYTGGALRYNRRVYGNDEIWVWETVSTMTYQNGHYLTHIPLSAHGGGDVDTWFVWPAHAAPLPESMQPIPSRYCIEARASFANSTGEFDPWWGHWGIVFGANESFNDIWTFQVNANKRWALIRYPTYVYPGNRSTDNETRLIDWGNSDHDEIVTGPGYNTLRVVVRDTRLDFYVNGIWFGHANLSSYPRAKIGLIAGDWEVTPVDVAVDYFVYDPYCPEAQQ